MDSGKWRISPKKQRGLTLVLVTAAMLALVGVAALSIDVNHAMLNKTRLQNSVDAAALAAAIVLDNGGSTTEAEAAAKTTLINMGGASGNDEMDFTSAQIVVQFSNDPAIFPFSGFNSDDDGYARVAVSGYQLDNFFAHILNVTKNLSSSAVAGPSPSNTLVTNVVPIAVCEGEDAGTNGYNQGDLYALKLADQNQSEMGPGNYQLLDFGSGASTVREALAGGYKGAIDITEPVITKPGNTIGPVGQGLNTRFDDYSGGGLSDTDYPSDIYVREPVKPAKLDNDGNITYLDTSGSGGGAWGYSDYLAALPDCSGDSDCRIDSGGEENRRVLVIPVVDCSSASGGTSAFNVTALACFFMLQSAPTSNSGKEAVFGEFIEDCTVSGGVPGQNSNSDGPYRIVLYRDPNGEES